MHLNGACVDFVTYAFENPGHYATFELWEDDGSSGDDKIGSWSPSQASWVFEVHGANKYNDGDNGEAEYYIKKLNYTNETTTVDFGQYYW